MKQGSGKEAQPDSGKAGSGKLSRRTGTILGFQEPEQATSGRVCKRMEPVQLRRLDVARVRRGRHRVAKLRSDPTAMSKDRRSSPHPRFAFPFADVGRHGERSTSRARGLVARRSAIRRAGVAGSSSSGQRWTPLSIVRRTTHRPFGLNDPSPLSCCPAAPLCRCPAFPLPRYLSFYLRCISGAFGDWPVELR